MDGFGRLGHVQLLWMHKPARGASTRSYPCVSGRACGQFATTTALEEEGLRPTIVRPQKTFHSELGPLHEAARPARLPHAASESCACGRLAALVTCSEHMSPSAGALGELEC